MTSPLGTNTYGLTETARGKSHKAAATQDGGKLTSVGHREVIYMHYEVWIGTMEANVPEILLVDTTSHTAGVSLSELKWGYYGETFGQDDAHLEFTIHDIAGQTIRDFLLAKSGKYWIYFKGPDSSGALWKEDVHARYSVVHDKCELTFSATQGFTYSFVAVPSGRYCQTQYMSLARDITVNGIGADGNNSLHSNTWEDYCKEIAHKWKQDLPGKKAGTANIKFVYDEGANLVSELREKPPVHVVADKGGTTDDAGGTTGKKIQPYTIKSGTPLAHGLMDLFQKRFTATEQNAGVGLDERPTLEVTYRDYTGEESEIDLKMTRQKTTDTTSIILSVCIGDDMNCGGAAYRATLVGLDFGDSLNGLIPAVLNPADETPTDNSSGNTVAEQTQVEKEQKNECGDYQRNENSGVIPMAAGQQPSTNSKFDGWGVMLAHLQKQKRFGMKLDIELRYTFAFSPQWCGGVFKDYCPGYPTGRIEITSGVDLRFFWYTDPSCEWLALVDEISTCWKIGKIQHTIGLNGNTTQLTLVPVTSGL